MTFDSDNYRRALADYEQNWRPMDETLYELCRVRPDHRTAASVNAKLWIIGRSYATGIERKVATKGSPGSSMGQVAAHILSHHEQVDQIFQELASIGGLLEPAKLRAIVDLHGRMVQLLRPITRAGQSVRSFTSKYMHFHNPLVPIYDSVAAGAIPRIVEWSKDLAVFTMSESADRNYGSYVMRTYRLYQTVQRAELPLSSKYLDHYVLWMDEVRRRLARAEPVNPAQVGLPVIDPTS